jgi:hypothetical protein
MTNVQDMVVRQPAGPRRYAVPLSRSPAASRGPAHAAAAVILMGLALNACSGPGISASDVPPGRGTTDDIDATLWTGPSSLKPGQSFPPRDEPNGATP